MVYDLHIPKYAVSVDLIFFYHVSKNDDVVK